MMIARVAVKHQIERRQAREQEPSGRLRMAFYEKGRDGHQGQAQREVQHHVRHVENAGARECNQVAAVDNQQSQSGDGSADQVGLGHGEIRRAKAEIASTCPTSKRGARTRACRVETLLDASVSRTAGRRQECRRGTHECVRHGLLRGSEIIVATAPWRSRLRFFTGATPRIPAPGA